MVRSFFTGGVLVGRIEIVGKRPEFTRIGLLGLRFLV